MILISSPVNALALVPLTESANVCVDDETGDIYVWNEEIDRYEKYDYSGDPVDSGVTYVIVDSPDPELPSSPDVESLDLEPIEVSGESIENIAAAVSEYTAADGYNLGTTHVSIFAGVAEKVPFNQHYVFWRDSQYSYKFAYGPISVDGAEFLSSGDVIVIDYSSNQSNYNSTYKYTTYVDRDFYLDAGDYLVYSDLGNYPDLYDRKGAKFNAFVTYAVAGIVIWSLFGNLRKAAFGR